MDTKWNNTTETVEIEPVMPQRKGTGLRAAAAFLTFFLGVSLTLGSLCGAVGRLAIGSDYAEWWQNDWQETPVFRNRISNDLESFLAIGVGRTVDWYHPDYSVEDTVSGTGTIWFFADTPTASCETSFVEAQDTSPDSAYKHDLNTIYAIRAADGKKYSNLEEVTGYRMALDEYSKLPKGYNFLLIYEDGKVSIWKDGKKLSVYDSDNILDEDSLWNVPGYTNFKVGEEEAKVTIKMAVRQIPILYKGSNSYSYNSLYWIYRSLQNSHEAWRSLAISFCVGLVLLAAWFVLRKERYAADQAIAKVTFHIWTELRFLAVFLCLLCLTVPMLAAADGYLWWYPDDVSYTIMQTLRCFGAGLFNPGAALGLFWAVWFIRNDHHYHPAETRKSLYRIVSSAMRKNELTYPIQKRINRRIAIRNLATVLAVLGSFALLYIYLETYDEIALLGICAVWLVLGLLSSILWGRRERALARDFGLLADHVAAVQSGELTTPLDLPADADLRETAERLNSIQSGLKAAVAEQTRSERMKVELISNVSHDLKTPLTSILSYSELLMQEPLEGAASDYAQIIQQKALRLKSMVQDVFEISKAASDQLPVKPEVLDFGKLLRQTLADMDGEIQKSGLTFKLDLPEQPVEITADGTRLYRVFQNLLQNALNYSLPGSRVYLSLKTTGKAAVASLRNTSRNELPEGVDFTARFVRGDESRTDGGTGLGLSVAKSFTEACGGTFRVETMADLFTAIVSFPLSMHEPKR